MRQAIQKIIVRKVSLSNRVVFAIEFIRPGVLFFQNYIINRYGICGFLGVKY
jgi:hypothetical protein